jgi:hypothetical protein
MYQDFEAVPFLTQGCHDRIDFLVTADVEWKVSFEPSSAANFSTRGFSLSFW